MLLQLYDANFRLYTPHDCHSFSQFACLSTEIAPKLDLRVDHCTSWCLVSCIPDIVSAGDYNISIPKTTVSVVGISYFSVDAKNVHVSHLSIA